MYVSSGPGTNLKVGGTGPERKGDGTDPAQSAGKKFVLPQRRKKIFVLPLHFLALKAQLVVLVSAFVMVSTA